MFELSTLLNDHENDLNPFKKKSVKESIIKTCKRGSREAFIWKAIKCVYLPHS